MAERPIDERPPSRLVFTTAPVGAPLPSTPEEAYDALEEARRAIQALPPIVTRIDAPGPVIAELQRRLPPRDGAWLDVELRTDDRLAPRAARVHRSDGSTEVIWLRGGA